MKDLQNDIKTGTFRRVYLLYGTEAYLRIRMRDRLISAILPDDAGMNLSFFSGNKTDEGAVIEQAETLPFFAEHRVIRLDDTGFFKGGAELLPDYMKSLPEYLCMVFTEHEVDRRSRMFKAVKAAGRCVEFKEQDAGTISAWVLRMLGDAGLRIRPADMEEFLGRCGSDMSHIFTETDKLIHYTAGRDQVTREDILAVTTNRTENRIFDMITAITRHETRAALDLYADLLALREPPMRILYLLGNEYRRLHIVKNLASEGYSDSQIAQKGGMPPFAVRRSRKIIEKYTEAQLRDAAAVCVRAEEDVKTGALSERVAVELTIIGLV